MHSTGGHFLRWHAQFHAPVDLTAFLGPMATLLVPPTEAVCCKSDDSTRNQQE